MDYIQGPDQKKYIVDNGRRFWIPNSLTRNALGLPISAFVTKPQTYIDQIPSEANIDDIERIRLVRLITNPAPVYAVFSAPVLEKRHIPDPKTFWALGLKWDQIENLSQAEFDSIPEGEQINNFNNWDEDIKRFTEERVPVLPASTVTVQINQFGVQIEDADIPLLLAYVEKGPNDVRDVLDMKAHFLQSFFNQNLNILNHEILGRYIETSQEQYMPSIVPSSPAFQKQIVEPLIYAKKEYCLGAYLASIALSGIVGEMIATYLWKFSEAKINGTNFTPATESNVFGEKFEELEQSHRIKILRAMNMDQGQSENLKGLATIRNKHIHPSSTLTSDDKADALQTYRFAAEAFKTIFGVARANASSLQPTIFQSRMMTQSP